MEELIWGVAQVKSAMKKHPEVLDIRVTGDGRVSILVTDKRSLVKWATALSLHINVNCTNAADGKLCVCLAEREMRDVKCPDCGKMLFRASETAEGIIWAWCKKCHAEKRIVLTAVKVPQQ